MKSLAVEINGKVAIAWIDNPPVNALSFHVRDGLVRATQLVADRPDLVGLVIASRSKIFIAGADIKEFDKPSSEGATLNDVLHAFDRSIKPVVAAINGSALGGGFEVALACHDRIASENGSVGLPEIKLGILPGAGGTQRLPRLISPSEALIVMTDGVARPARVARDLGIVSAVVTLDRLIDTAVARVCQLAAQGPLPRLRDRTPPETEREAFEKVAAKLAASRGDEPQISAIIDCVRATFDMGFDEGLALERAHFVRLLRDDRSKAMRHAFFSERAAGRLPKVADIPRHRGTGRVSVIGGGTMGTGIAMNFANVGIPVTIIETDMAGAERAAHKIAETYDVSVARGSLSKQERDARVKLVETSSALESVAGSDLIIEAVFEEMKIKKELFRKLDEIAGDDAVLATNTSFLDVNEIGHATQRPERVVGMHFFSPANVMKLVEIVRAEKTRPDVLAAVTEVSRKIGKIPVIVGVCHGFVGNRMMTRRSEQMDRLLLEGASPSEIDAAMTSFGFKMGPCAVGDLAGLDISWRMRRATGKTAPVADALVAADRLGQKTRKGYYRYPEGARTGEEDPAVAELLRVVSASHRVVRRAIPREELLDRLLLPMINEGARILEEGIASRPGDIDVIWLNGYGFPSWRGGPMYYADQRGLENVAERLSEFAHMTGDSSLEPASLLVRLAREKQTFGSLAAA